MHLMHASTTNQTHNWRLSCDVRYQPAADPMDPRWADETPGGHDGRSEKPVMSMAEAREKWGV